MKKFLSTVLTLTVCSVLQAQVFIDFSQYEQSRNTRVNLKVGSAADKSPLGFATVYLVPDGDTTIVNFTLTDEQGKAKFDKVVQGKYKVNVEYIGYKAFSKVYDIRGWEKDLGLIELEEDPEYIDPATITALANPVTIKQDTIEYNAAAFRTGTNDMLEDLLKRLPGMSVGEDGSVSVNGEKVDKITVGGKTFFFNDPKVAVKNLPAAIVNKIKVIDRDKDKASFTGVATADDREKVMDVELKDEYKQGWFGNARASAGAEIVSKEKRRAEGQPGMLFNAGGMVSNYNEKDQTVILGSAQNIDLSGGSMVVYILDDDSDGLAYKRGINTNGQIGANYNTERIKGFEANASASYTYSGKDAREKSERLSFTGTGTSYSSSSRYKGIGHDHKLNVSCEIQNKDRKRWMLGARPSFSWSRLNHNISNSSLTLNGADTVNSGISSTKSVADNFLAMADIDAGIKNMGKKGRNLSANVFLRSMNVRGNSYENSSTVIGDGSIEKNLDYDRKRNVFGIHGSLTYTEPLSEYWKLQLLAQTDYMGDNSDNDATDALSGAENAYYSSYSANNDLNISERFIVQYKKGIYNLQFGAAIEQERNVTTTRAHGFSATTGKDRWFLNYSPSINLNFKPGLQNIGINFSGNSDTPTGLSISPILNLSDPVRLSTGNIYLRPGYNQRISLRYRGRTNDNVFNWNTSIYTSLQLRRRVEATWFDDSGIRYSVPVNSQDPGVNSQAYFNGTVNLDRKSRFSLTLDLSGRIGTATSYQADGTDIISIDRDAFDYKAFISEFYGDAGGDRFYSGESGFRRSRTDSYRYNTALGFTYRSDALLISLKGNATNDISRYSLDQRANTNAWIFGGNAEVDWTLPKDWKIRTDCSYRGYRGYSYSRHNEFLWNAEISKSLKMLTFTLRAMDLLNQRSLVQRQVSGEYISDIESNGLGRCILFGISLNFGKMNAKQNSKVQSAMWNIAF